MAEPTWAGLTSPWRMISWNPGVASTRRLIRMGALIVGGSSPPSLVGFCWLGFQATSHPSGRRDRYELDAVQIVVGPERHQLEAEISGAQALAHVDFGRRHVLRLDSVDILAAVPGVQLQDKVGRVIADLETQVRS